jgi:hypothetical protein
MKREMRSGQHWHRVRVTGCTRGTMHVGGSGWPVVSRARWAASTSDGGHRRTVPVQAVPMATGLAARLS